MGKITLVSEFRFSTTIWLIAQKRVFFFFYFPAVIGHSVSSTGLLRPPRNWIGPKSSSS